MKRFLVVCGVVALVAGVAYLATVGCCSLVSSRKGSLQPSWVDQLQLSGEQKQAVHLLEKNFLSQKGSACQKLRAKRALLIQLMKQPEPDRTGMLQLAEEIGQEQIGLEKDTVDHFLSVRKLLNPAQQAKLTDSVTEELRSACQMTVCGATPGCSVSQESKKNP